MCVCVCVCVCVWGGGGGGGGLSNSLSVALVLMYSCWLVRAYLCIVVQHLVAHQCTHSTSLVPPTHFFGHACYSLRKPCCYSSPAAAAANFILATEAMLSMATALNLDADVEKYTQAIDFAAASAS